MANEARGILFETITEAALQRAVKGAGIPDEVRWNVKPKGMSVVPDFTVGVDKDRPSHVVLVTASGSSKEAEKKSWRNLGELQEVKAQLPDAPAVLNLYFKSEVKQGLSLATQRLYDTTIHVERKSYHRHLEGWVATKLKTTAKTRQARRELLESDIRIDVTLAEAVEDLASDLAEALQQRNKELDPLWSLMREDYRKSHDPPSARDTSVRRGLGKLLVLEPNIRRSLYESHNDSRGIIAGQIPDYAFTLGFFRKTISGARLYDDEIKGVLSLLGSEACEILIEQVPVTMQSWVNELRQLENVAEQLTFVRNNFQKLTKRDHLLNLLIECHRNPLSFAEAHGVMIKGQLDRNWLFTVLMDLIKASTGRLTGFGYSQLSSELGESKGISSGYISIADWTNRVAGATVPLSVLREVAEVLANKVANIGESRLHNIGDRLVAVTKKSILENRLIPYRNFEPLLWLFKVELQKQGVSHVWKIPYEGWVNEYARVGRRVATTPFVKVGNTLVHWKSVSDAGKVHKKKELAARARSVKYQYHPDTSAFTRRMGVDRLTLIVDGTFDDADLKVISEAGWDRIVYPDEIRNFVRTFLAP